MSQKERIKLEIDILKALIIAFLTAIFGIFGYAVMSYEKINTFQGICILIGLTLLFGVLYALAKRVIKDLNKMEELE